MKNFKNVVCPTDFSAASKEAIQFAADLMHASDSKLYLFHSFEIPIITDNYGVNYYDQLYSHIKKEAEDNMEALKAEMKQRYPSMQIECEIQETNDPAMSVVEYAHKQQADMIVMSSHGRRGLKRLLMGSVTEGVMRLTQIPVMVLKPKNIV